ncbi:hypothetical protein BGY98DRAFT_324397 [Russula aff. rugulosa BPL654]|nr:hypothetical protein BGY98DRAFT_324397 [Russula aff. rugulosa BPL654]
MASHNLFPETCTRAWNRVAVLVPVFVIVYTTQMSSKSNMSLETILSTTTMVATCRRPMLEMGLSENGTGTFCLFLLCTTTVTIASQNASAVTRHHRPIMPNRLSLLKKPVPNTPWTAFTDDDIISSFQGRPDNAFSSIATGSHRTIIPRLKTGP